MKACLDGEVINSFKDYFELSSHGKNTRKNSKLIRLPRINTEYARKRFYFYFTGGKIYNSFPVEVRSLQKHELSKYITEYVN